MLKDVLLSFRDNFKEKTTNPFLGTYALVWLIRNWELVYTLFNFDSDYKLDQKVLFVKNYYSNCTVWGELWQNTWITFVILLFSYLLINLSRFIVNLSEKQLKPYIYKITDSKSIVLKSDFERVKNERDEFQDRIDNQRSKIGRLDTKIKALEQQIIELQTIDPDENKESKETRVDNDQDHDEIKYFFKKLLSKGFVKEFQEIGTEIKKQFSIKDSPSLNFFLQLGLVDFDSPDDNSEKFNFYNLTEVGLSLFTNLHSLIESTDFSTNTGEDNDIHFIIKQLEPLENGRKDFLKIGTRIRKGDYIFSDTPPVDFAATHGLIEYTGKSSPSGDKQFQFTELGNKVFNRLLRSE
jgi:hypothetical protein